MAHGKGARAKSKMKRMALKRATKASRQALWDSLKGTSKNKKKKRGGGEFSSVASVRTLMEVRLSSKSTETGMRMVHGGSACGNIGCKRCSPLWRIAA